MLTAMAKRYDQFCPVAHALSLVGERWSLLVVRELLKGPRRYTDLAAGLPGIGTNILATRLRDLETAGVVEKRKLPPPVASTVYQLTEYGAGLEEAVHAIARWGARSLGPPPADEVLDPEWGLNAFPALLYPERARGLTETYVIGVDDQVFTVRLDDGSLTVELGATEDADLVARTDMAAIFALGSGDLAAEDAVAQDLVRLDAGDVETLARFFRVFSFAPRVATPAPARDDGRLGPRVRVETAIPVA
jgi:DNA-binding HxlR family transcriptional regulator